MKKNFIWILLAIIILCGISIWLSYNKSQVNLVPSNQPPPGENLIAQVTFLCKDNKTIEASFYKGEAKPVEPGEPPIPRGKVKLVLSDGRSFELPQTISASGARYANSDESFVFWNKGNGALVLENNEEKNYIGCVILAKDSGNLLNTYLDAVVGFTIRYPIDYKIDTSYKYQALGPGKEIGGVKFIIPESFATGTNLSSFDTGISVEIIPTTENCQASLFLPVTDSTEVENLVDNNIEYSFAKITEGAAGNYYEEQVWALIETNPCIALRYLIHSTNINNYPERMVKEFDRANLLNTFDKIRSSLVIL
ncbi:MAG TPA: MliC family protein [Candidatus Paceibacterota bacterium]|nr:MliC family protein [Candidatus Paceibacterota bacterium]HOK97240.1 MliC family protein [Candidatus Paceibacterota bacterium]HPP64569.1 MliC family protein [Candidatus Paceibacterota bacterium]